MVTMLLSPNFMCNIHKTYKEKVVEMKNFKEIPSGVLAFGVLVSVALFIWIADKNIVGFVVVSLLVLFVAYLFWFVLTKIIDVLRGE